MKLHGSQTIQFHLYVTHSIWRDVKLQGAQTLQPLKITNVQVWKKIKLHGTQIPPRYALPVTGLVEGKITWYSNTDFPGCLAE